jgi:heme exporter protein A
VRSLIATDLACERNGRLVFANLSFQLKPGECAELRGANGAGKSSLLRLIAGLVPVEAGSLTLDGSSDLPTQCNYIGHLDALKSAMTVSENLSFWGDCFGASDIGRALSAFDLSALRDESVQLLSAGQRRRLSLSRLFLTKRPLWLLDEPMNALDAASQHRLLQHMRDHLSGGGIVMVATHGDLGISPDHVITLGTA